MADLFSPLGEIVGVDDAKHIEVLIAITSLMSSHYALLWEVVKWGEKEGLSKKVSVDYNPVIL